MSDYTTEILKRLIEQGGETSFLGNSKYAGHLQYLVDKGFVRYEPTHEKPHKITPLGRDEYHRITNEILSEIPQVQNVIIGDGNIQGSSGTNFNTSPQPIPEPKKKPLANNWQKVAVFIAAVGLIFTVLKALGKI